ncbi:MAG: B12-binding domain-containing radical SAM protein [Bacillota bacterium]
MKINLIAPAWQHPLWEKEKTKSIFPPLNLATIAALTPDDIQVTIVDESFEDVRFDADVDLVGISAMTAIAPRAYEIADSFRSRGVKVVLGGMHPSALPEEAAAHADAVVVGEAENTWPQLIEDFRANSLQKFYKSAERPALAGMVAPKRSLIEKNHYLMANTMQTTRGCPYGCSFCTVTKFFGRSYRFRPVEDIIAEVKSLGNGLVAFIDDNIIGSPKFAKKLFKALIPLRIKWISQASLNLAENEELLQLAAASGCVGMFIGFESLSPDNLKASAKSQNHADSYLDAIKRIHAHGIAIEGAFIFGFDHDDESVFEQTVRFTRRAKLEAVQFGILTPFPGTQLAAELEAQGRITSNDWAKYDIAHVVFEPKLMSARTLQAGSEWAWKEFYTLGSIAQRLGLKRKNGAFLWALNLNIKKRVARVGKSRRSQAAIGEPSPYRGI